LDVTQKKVYAEAKKAEKQRRDAEESLEKAKAVAEDAARRAQSVAVDLKEAATAVADAQRIVERASKELESLVRAGR
jgi:F0F1-type ATP synthase membrane subunit b/b'